jgi:hypothetical protein
LAAAIPAGSTIRNIAVERPIPIALQRINMAVQLAGAPHPRVRQVRVKAPVNRGDDPRPIRWIAAAEIEVEPIAAVQAQAAWIEAAPAQARWIGVAAVQEETKLGIEAFLPPPAAETAVRSEAAQAVQAGVPLERAAAEDLPAMEEVPAALAAEVAARVAEDAVVAAEDGGK